MKISSPCFSVHMCSLFLSSSIQTYCASQSSVNFLKLIMSALVTISDEILIFTYCEVGLSILTIVVNLVNFFWIRQTFVKTLVFQIQQIDSIVTSVCQIGFIAILLSSISDAPNVYICTTASGLVAISILHFLLSNLLIVIGR